MGQCLVESATAAANSAAAAAKTKASLPPGQAKSKKASYPKRVSTPAGGGRGGLGGKSGSGAPAKSEWKVNEYKFAGSTKWNSVGKKEVLQGSIAKGKAHFLANPKKYTAMTFQTSMLTNPAWKEDQQKYTYIHREGTAGYKPQGVSPSGWMTMLTHEHQCELPKQKCAATPAGSVQGGGSGIGAPTNTHAEDPFQNATEDPLFQNADKSKWKLKEYKFAGATKMKSVGKKEVIRGSIAKGKAHFLANPKKYTAMTFKTNMLTDPAWTEDRQQYTYIHRVGTVGYTPQGVSPSGWMTMLMQEYQCLPPFPNNELPKQHCDKYTDTVLSKWNGKKLNKFYMPGRGMGVVDTPNLKIIGDVDPSDIHQGSVGCCWLLSGISSLAEFDGAIKRLFRKTKNLDKRPLEGPNSYTVTLWELSTWKEVDIVIDERLCAHPTMDGQLLSSKPSEDGELWVCYLEKALAAHCGGWDKITGGKCTHAWALMTGCKEQYTIKKNKSTGKYGCYARYNPRDKQWMKHTNSPHDSNGSVYRVAWPQVGGGGDEEKELTPEEMFLRFCAWDDTNYIMGAGRSSKGSKGTLSEGMVDNHAYSVIEAKKGVAETNIDLLKVRNPWGRGEIQNGEFDDDGPGWDKYPQIKEALNPVVADDGIFWVTKDEFFEVFDTFYLSASNMTEFLED